MGPGLLQPLVGSDMLSGMLIGGLLFGGMGNMFSGVGEGSVISWAGSAMASATSEAGSATCSETCSSSSRYPRSAARSSVSVSEQPRSIFRLANSSPRVAPRLMITTGR